MTLGIGATPVGPGAWAVRPHCENFPLNVGTAVIEIHGPGANRKSNILSQTAVGPITVVEESSNLNRCERTVLVRPCFDIMSERRPVMRVKALFFPRKPNFYRPSGLPRQERAEYGEPPGDLYTESAAEVR